MYVSHLTFLTKTRQNPLNIYIKYSLFFLQLFPISLTFVRKKICCCLINHYLSLTCYDLCSTVTFNNDFHSTGTETWGQREGSTHFCHIIPKATSIDSNDFKFSWFFTVFWLSFGVATKSSFSLKCYDYELNFLHKGIKTRSTNILLSTAHTAVLVSERIRDITLAHHYYWIYIKTFYHKCKYLSCM